MSPPTIAELQTAIMDLLPDDGTPVLKRVMRVMLGRRFKSPVEEEAFFAARDALFDAGSVGRMRGQGGQLFRATPAETQPAAPAPREPAEWTEQRLMEPLRLYLEGPFRTSLDLPPSGACIVQDTSVIGPQRGRWARPDFILVSAMRFKLMPGAQVDLHSFELKTEIGGGVLAIHEALAQTRFTHFGHFVWHLPTGSKNEALLDEIVTHCEEHGIGLIRMKDPRRAGDEDACEILVDPHRKPILGSVVDGFLESRLSLDQKSSLLRAIGGSA